MIDFGCKCHLGGFEGIICGKVNGEEENSTLERAVIGAHDSRLPVKQVLSHRTSGTLCWGVPLQIHKFLLNPFQRHVVPEPAERAVLGAAGEDE